MAHAAELLCLSAAARGGRNQTVDRRSRSAKRKTETNAVNEKGGQRIVSVAGAGRFSLHRARNEAHLAWQDRARGFSRQYCKSVTARHSLAASAISTNN